jgi:hypothetical protein
MVRTFPRLEVLEIAFPYSRLKIEGSLESFVFLPNLKELILPDSMVIGNIASLARLKQLRRINLSGNFRNIHGNLSHLVGLTELIELKLGLTDVEGDIASLSNVVKLERLSLGFVSGSINSLANLRRLTEVYLCGVRGDLAVMTLMPHLARLALVHSKVKGDLAILGSQKQLRRLYLPQNPQIFGDVACLQGLTKLEWINLEGTSARGLLPFFPALLYRGYGAPVTFLG